MKDCKVKKKTNNLNILEDFKNILYEEMLNSLEFESRFDSGNEVILINFYI